MVAERLVRVKLLVEAPGAAAAGEQAARALDRTAAGADKTQSSLNKSSLAAKGFAAASGALAGVGLIDFLQDSVNAASDLNETMAKSRVIFGASGASVQKWSQDAAKNLGLSKAAALEAAANFGNMFTQLGYTSKAAADLSTKTVQMAADLGSFNNLPTADVADRISAAFRGEYDALQLLIPNINAARVEQQAMADTGKENAKALTAQEKAAAVLAIVNKDGAAAMGDFARTADGFANSSKTATALLEDQKAALGEKLMPVWQGALDLFSTVGLPVLSAIADVLGVVVDVVRAVPEPVLLAGAAFAGWKLLDGPITGFLGNMHSGMLRVSAEAPTMASKVSLAAKTINTAMGPVGWIIAGVTTVISLFTGGADEAKEATARWRGEVDDLKGTLDAASGAITELTKQKIADKMIGGETLMQWEKFGIDTKLLLDGITQVPGAAEKSSQALLGLATSAINASPPFQQFEARLGSVGVSAEDMGRALLNGVPPELNTRLQGAGLSLSIAADGQLKLTDTAKGTSVAINDQAGSLDILKQAYDKQNGITGGVVAGQMEIAAQNRAIGASAEGASGLMSTLGRAIRDVAAVEIGDKLFQINAQDNATPALQSLMRYYNSLPKDLSFTSSIKNVGSTIGALVLGKTQAAGGYWEGGVQHAAAGLHRQSQIARGGADIIHWAEKSIPWETYISGSPSQKVRSDHLMGITAAKLGGYYVPSSQQSPTASMPPMPAYGPAAAGRAGGSNYQVTVNHYGPGEVTPQAVVRALRQAERV